MNCRNVRALYRTHRMSVKSDLHRISPSDAIYTPLDDIPKNVLLFPGNRPRPAMRCSLPPLAA